MRWPLWRAVVVERSMEPALRPGDWLLVVRRTMALRRLVRVRPGQLVVARHPEQPGMLIVKRAQWREGGAWWLASDNPAAPGAEDSSAYGAVPASLIEGRVLLRYRRAPRTR
jgi:nickel-type superoxide dismutase maturation protease